LIETIKHGDTILAVVLPANHRSDGIQFFTPDEFSQQLAYMNHPNGHVISPHIHNEVKREVQFTKEVLFIRSGRLRVDFYDESRIYLESRMLEAGDVILLAHGGHGFEMLEDTEIVEVKQGPYAGNEDKTRFDGITAVQAVFNRPA
jgi:mannose-6-phosphate isomerase-like protein (cupin superfamily)